MKKTIYLAGPVTKIGFKNAYERFMTAESFLKYYYEVKNPIHYGFSIDKSWEDVMKCCIKDLLDCDAIILLEGWKDSKGACLEKFLAESLNIPVYYYEEIATSCLETSSNTFIK